MALHGNDLVVTRRNGDSVGYVHPVGTEFGQPSIVMKKKPSVPLGSSTTPADAPGGVYDVRSSDGPKAITHLSWELGAGQKSLDTSNASPYRYRESEGTNIEIPGELSIGKRAVYTLKRSITGPFISALGKIWAAKVGGGAFYSSDNGATWVDVNVSGTGLPTDAAVTSWCTDGTYLYAAVPGGSTPGVYISTWHSGSHYDFAIMTNAHEKVSQIAYLGGYIFGAQTNLNSDSRVYLMWTSDSDFHSNPTALTPSMMKYFTSVALTTAGNSLYWVVSNAGQSFVYKLSFDVATKTLATEQYVEFPLGFTATCAVGYLSNIYVGGYFSSSASTSVGQGAIYVASDGRAAPLMTLGEKPEYTAIPADAENDNRIMSICSGVKDLYFNTNRGVYRWDIDDGGYSHVFSLTNSGQSPSAVVWDPGSVWSWNGTDYGGGHVMPSGWDDQPQNGAGWSFDSGGAHVTGADQYSYQLINGAPTLNNATGWTFEIRTLANNTANQTISIRDGSYRYRATIGPTTCLLEQYLEVHHYSHVTGSDYVCDDDRPPNCWWQPYDYYSYTGTGTYQWSGDYERGSLAADHSLWTGSHITDTLHREGAHVAIAASGDRTVRITGQGSTCIMTVTPAGGTPSSVSTTQLEPSALSDQISMDWYMGSGCQSIKLGTEAAVQPHNDAAQLSMAGLAYHNGKPYSGYNISSGASILIASVADGGSSTTQINFASVHGFTNTTGQYVTIAENTGHSHLDGTWAVTYVDTDSIKIAHAYTAQASGFGYMVKEGFVTTSTALAATSSLTQSYTNFHTGTMAKDFQFIEFLHEQLPSGAAIAASVEIDGETTVLSSATIDSAGRRTRFPINVTGYSIMPTYTLTCGTDTAFGPKIHAVNVIWDFVRVPYHQYTLDCRAGAGGGAWREDPQTAINHLMAATDERSLFEDSVSTGYYGSIEEIEYIKAPTTLSEGNSGVLKVSVREIE